MINDPGAISLCRTAIVGFLMCVALHVLTRGKAGVDISNTFMVGDKVDAIINPHRCSEIAFYRRKRLKLSISVCVYPELSCCAATITFPSCGFACQPSEYDTTITTECNVVSRSVGKTLGFATFRRNAPNPCAEC